jgi:hypothetical protein
VSQAGGAPSRAALAREAGFVDYRGTRPEDNPLLNPPKEAWFVQASRGGAAVRLTPEFFPFCRSRDECRERAMERVRRDPAFRELFRGHILHYVMLSDCLEIR